MNERGSNVWGLYSRRWCKRHLEGAGPGLVQPGSMDDDAMATGTSRNPLTHIPWSRWITTEQVTHSP